MKTEDIITQEHTYILQTYGRPDFVLDRGEGVHLFDTDGNRYLDFVSGLGVNALGYGNPLIVETVKEQVERLIHCCNLYHSIHIPYCTQGQLHVSSYHRTTYRCDIRPISFFFDLFCYLLKHILCLVHLDNPPSLPFSEPYVCIKNKIEEEIAVKFFWNIICFKKNKNRFDPIFISNSCCLKTPV